MRIEVTALEIGAVVRATFAEQITSGSDEVPLDEPVVGQVEVSRTARTVRLSGHVATTAPLVCGRCLEPYRQRLAVALSDEFIADAVETLPGDGRLDLADFALPLGRDRVLDVTEVIRQHLLLGAPMVPLCSPTCRGLCPQCGVNWNHQTCTCTPDAIDPRLAPLQQFGKHGDQET